MASVKEIYRELDALIPRSLSASWDNDGLMVCPDGEREVRRVLLSLDATAAVCREADGCELILTHHPVIFRRQGDVSSERPLGEKIISLIKKDVAVMSFHTRFDACDGGMNDILARKFGLSNVQKFGDDEAPTLARIGDVDKISTPELCEKVKLTLGTPRLLCADARKPIKRLAVCGGGGGDFLIPALELGADAIITGECSYNSAIDARDAGITVIEAGHYYTEAVFAAFFEEFFAKNHPNIEVVRSRVGCEIQAI